MNLIDYFRMFNDLTTPIAFFITLGTFYLAKTTQTKLKMTEEITLLNQSFERYVGKLEAIELIIDQYQKLDDKIPDTALINLVKISSEIEYNYPTLAKKKKIFAVPLKKIKRMKHNKEIELVDVIDSFNSLNSIFINRKTF